MPISKVAGKTALWLLAVPIVVLSAAIVFFYSVFYFPNRANALTGTVVSSGEKRDYLLYVPKSYHREKPAPLVITLHTLVSWPAAVMSISHWNELADEQGLIVAYPAGTGLGPKSWRMKGLETPSRMPDVVFISDLIDELEASYNIDKRRIYVDGMSNGGTMTFVLSCQLSDRLAAVGMVSAGLYPDWPWCRAGRSVPVIAFHGTADPICPYDGGSASMAGGSLPSVRGFFAHWARRNRCGPDPVESAVAPDVTRLEYPGCGDGADVALYTIEGEGHQWPGGTPIAATWLVGPYSRGIDATRAMWAFFDEHPLPSG